MRENSALALGMSYLALLFLSGDVDKQLVFPVQGELVVRAGRASAVNDGEVGGHEEAEESAGPLEPATPDQRPFQCPFLREHDDGGHGEADVNQELGGGEGDAWSFSFFRVLLRTFFGPDFHASSTLFPGPTLLGAGRIVTIPPGGVNCYNSARPLLLFPPP